MSIKKIIKKEVFGSLADCMRIIKKSKIKNTSPMKRLYDSYDIVELNAPQKNHIVSTYDNFTRFRRQSTDEMIGNIISVSELKETDDIYKLTLYKYKE